LPAPGGACSTRQGCVSRLRTTSSMTALLGGGTDWYESWCCWAATAQPPAGPVWQHARPLAASPDGQVRHDGLNAGCCCRHNHGTGCPLTPAAAAGVLLARQHWQPSGAIATRPRALVLLVGCCGMPHAWPGRGWGATGPGLARHTRVHPSPLTPHPSLACV
jgi:hypothetical protein